MIDKYCVKECAAIQCTLMATKNFTLRLGTDELLERLDRLAEVMNKRARLSRLTRSDAVRASVEAGLAALEAEYGLAATSRTTKGKR
jgi:predicted transcriptional regulator